MEYRALQWEGRVRAVRVGEIPEAEADGTIAYAMKQAAMYRDLAVHFGISMTEERRGKGKRRRVVHYDDDDDDDAEKQQRLEEDDVGQDEDEDELMDLRGDLIDEEFFLRGGDDD